MRAWGKIARIDVALWLGVMALAVVLRFGWWGVNSFAFDEARLSRIALDFARGGVFPSVGMPSSAGVPNMPAAAWLLALPYALAPSAWLATGFIAALNVCAVAGIWSLARGWGRRAAWTAALIVAAHPFAVLYARNIWAQDLLIPLAVLWLWAAERAPRSRWALGLAVFLTGFALQVHFAGAALILAGAYAFLRWRWWRAPLAVILGAVGALVCALPFALAEGTLARITQAGGGGRIDAAALRELLRLLSAWDWRFLLHGDAALPLSRLTLADVNVGLGALLLVCVALLVTVGLSRGGDDGDKVQPPPAQPAVPVNMNTRARLELYVVLLCAAPLLFTYHSTPVLLHYLLMSLPPAALIVGWLASGSHWSARLLRWGVVGLALIWTGALARGLTYAATQHTPNGMPEPLITLQAAADAPSAELPVLFFTHGDDANIHGEAAIFSVLWWGRTPPARIIDGTRVLILPSTPATLLFSERPFPAWEELRAANLFSSLTEIPRRAPLEPFQMSAYDGHSAPQGFTLLETPITLGHGATLRGWRVYRIGEVTRVSTLWAANGALSESVQQFHHLRPIGTDANTPPLHGADVSVRGHLWQAGDTVIVMGDFYGLPSNARYTLHIGHYTLPDLQRVAVPNTPDNMISLGTLQIPAPPD